MRKFWKWTNRKVTNQETGQEQTERTLFLNGTIAEETWFDDDVTPNLFKDELMAESGDVTVWINSPGGDCVAAAQIYNMLKSYNGKVTVKIDGIAASAASVIAMAGSRVLMSPVSMMMIHNPATIAFGDSDEMQKAIDMLAGVKDSIINAYELKTGMSRAKLSHLMDAETWMDATKAVELGFADDIMFRNDQKDDAPDDASSAVLDGGDDKDGAKNTLDECPMLFSRRAVTNSLMNKLTAKAESEKAPKPEPTQETGRNIDSLYERLNLIKKHI